MKKYRIKIEGGFVVALYPDGTVLWKYTYPAFSIQDIFNMTLDFHRRITSWGYIYNVDGKLVSVPKQD